MRPLVFAVGWGDDLWSYGRKLPSVGTMTRSSSGSSKGWFRRRQQKCTRSVRVNGCSNVNRQLALLTIFGV